MRRQLGQPRARGGGRCRFRSVGRRLGQDRQLQLWHSGGAGGEPAGDQPRSAGDQATNGDTDGGLRATFPLEPTRPASRRLHQQVRPCPLRVGTEHQQHVVHWPRQRQQLGQHAPQHHDQRPGRVRAEAWRLQFRGRPVVWHAAVQQPWRIHAADERRGGALDLRHVGDHGRATDAGLRYPQPYSQHA
eukprot:COSAG04_NODE_521_length_13158_cov_26.145647_11_plen_188_part_00